MVISQTMLWKVQDLALTVIHTRLLIVLHYIVFMFYILHVCIIFHPDLWIKYKDIYTWMYLNTFFKYLYLSFLKWKVFVINNALEIINQQITFSIQNGYYSNTDDNLWYWLSWHKTDILLEHALYNMAGKCQSLVFRECNSWKVW